MDVLGRCAHFLRQPEAAGGGAMAFKDLQRRHKNPRGFGEWFTRCVSSNGMSTCAHSSDRGLSNSSPPPRPRNAFLASPAPSLAAVLGESLSDDEEDRVSTHSALAVMCSSHPSRSACDRTRPSSPCCWRWGSGASGVCERCRSVMGACQGVSVVVANMTCSPLLVLPFAGIASVGRFCRLGVGVHLIAVHRTDRRTRLQSSLWCTTNSWNATRLPVL